MPFGNDEENRVLMKTLSRRWPCLTASFMEYTRMSVDQYENLLLQVGPKLQSISSRNDIITPSQQLMITISYLATGESMKSLHTQFRMGVSTIHCKIVKVLHVLWETLQPKVLKMPETQEEWQKIIDDYDMKWNFPHCWGALDGKQVVMQAQPDTGSENYNYKCAHSINLLALCDANYIFTAVHVGARGRESDGGVLKNSNFGKRLLSGTLNLPPPSELYPGNLLIPQVCVADEGFPLHPNSMRPFPGKSSGRLSNKQRIFNYRLSRARRVIESTFGIMASRWRIFRVPINASLMNIKMIILAAVCLHNFIQRSQDNLSKDKQYYCPREFVDRIENERQVDGDWRRDFQLGAFEHFLAIRQEHLSAVRIRLEFMKYFMNEGQVAWQQQKLDAGAF